MTHSLVLPFARARTDVYTHAYAAQSHCERLFTDVLTTAIGQ